ncbi:MAG: hypothetical protein IJA69_02695 [Clostridia bacterium]|nr:hypothetical protein [Clostridia bacterium]
MTYNELVENQIVIATIQRELPIVITRHKKTAQYSFYYFNGGNFDFVDKNTETELKKIYNSNLGDSFAADTFNNQTFEFKAAYVESTLPICDACLDYFLHIIPQEHRQKCADNANGLKYSFESAKNTSFFVAENRINVAHVYKNKFLLAENLIHENIHCLTKNSKALCCGIIQRTAYATSQSDKIVTAFGEGMNEAITDFLHTKFFVISSKKTILKPQIP